MEEITVSTMGKARSANSLSGSRGSMSCMLTPVVGANIEIGNDPADSLNLSEGSDRWDQFCDTNESEPTASTSAPPPSSEAILDADSDASGEPSTSPQLVSCFRIESSADYQVAPDYLHSSALVVDGEASETPVGERCRRKTCEWMYGKPKMGSRSIRYSKSGLLPFKYEKN